MSSCSGSSPTYATLRSVSTSTMFTSRSWNGCSSTQGGAICFANQTTSSLTVKQCTFYNCNSSSTGWVNGGGAIHCYNVYSVSLLFCSFISCSATAGSGGGVNMYTIIQQPYIHTCDFISCFACDDGGGINVWYSNAMDDKLACKDCRFIKETVKGSRDPSGGCLLYYPSNGLICANSLFSNSEAYYGGAFYILYTNYPSGMYPLQFCFFNTNKGTVGNDITLDKYVQHNTNLVLKHCFSTSNSDRIGYYNNAPATSKDNWLP